MYPCCRSILFQYPIRGLSGKTFSKVPKTDEPFYANSVVQLNLARFWSFPKSDTRATGVSAEPP